MAEYWDRERGRRYRGEGYYGGYYGYPSRERDRERDWERERRDDDRGFFDRAGDEVRSWFGDEDAQRRRVRDERETERPWGNWRNSEQDTERDWAQKWGYIEPRGGRYDRESPRGWGYSGGYGAGAGFTGGRSDWSGGGWTTPQRFGAMMGAGPHVGRGPRGYQRSDERIREDVCERMSQCGDLDASDIEVRVSNAEVTLLGLVHERQDKRLAEDLADQVAGVREVHNQLRVDRGQSGAQDTQQPPRQGDQQRYRIA